MGLIFKNLEIAVSAHVLHQVA